MKISRLASQAICLVVSVSLSGITTLPAYATSGVDKVLESGTIGPGDTAEDKPSAEEICETLNNAMNEKFVDSNGNELKIIDQTCAKNYVYRKDQAAKCSFPLREVIANAKKEFDTADVDSLCEGSLGRLSPKMKSYCSLRSIAKSSQAMQYCNAYMSADQAQKSSEKIIYFDIAAAGVCYADYVALRLSKGSTPSPIAGKACGGAAMAGVLAELVYTASILGPKKDHFATEKGGARGKGPGRTGGGYKINSSNQVKDRRALGKALEITASTALSAGAFMMALCYYKPTGDAGKLCNQFKSIANDPNSAAKRRYVNKAVKTGAFKDKDGQKYTLDENFGGDTGAFCTAAGECGDFDSEIQAKANLALQTALIFTALAGIRGLGQATASKTKNKVSDILQSMFDPTNPNATLDQGGMGGTSLPNLFAATANAYATTPNTNGTQSAVVASPDDSAFLAPPGSPLNIQAAKVGARIPESALRGAGESGSGLGNAVASAAMAAGVTDTAALNKLRSHAASIFANLPREEGGYSSGGGRGLASNKSSGGGMDLNLKGLFGGEAKEEPARAGAELAFRGPAAAEDIWHSQNPNGHNLFQIVSEKYDHAQRRSAVGPDL